MWGIAAARCSQRLKRRECVRDLSILDRLANFKIGGDRSQPEIHGYFRPSLELAWHSESIFRTVGRFTFR